jgi:hypothetical protein
MEQLEGAKVISRDPITASGADGTNQFEIPIGTEGDVLYIQDKYIVIGLGKPFWSLFKQPEESFSQYWSIAS